jgi:hypothetical protein
MSQGIKLALLLVAGAVGSIVVWGMLVILFNLAVEAVL